MTSSPPAARIRLQRNPELKVPYRFGPLQWNNGNERSSTLHWFDFEPRTGELSASMQTIRRADQTVICLAPSAVSITLLGETEMGGKHAGSCLCGQVHFEVEGDFEQFFLCHCEHCRKDTGSAHAANLFSSTAKLTWLRGQDKVTSFTLPSTRHSRCFCSVCGSALPSLQNAGALLVVPAGSLDGDVRVRPNAHIFLSSKADWDRSLESLPSFEGLPS